MKWFLTFILRFLTVLTILALGFIIVYLGFNRHLLNTVPEPEPESESINLSDYSAISAISQLATLRSYYHNIAQYKQNGGFIGIGYKQLWMEYSGTVEIGVDASMIQIGIPDENGVINAYVPDARVLSINADEESLTEPIEETGNFTKITTEDRTKAFAEAQSEMRETAENDNVLLRRAKSNAKRLLQQFIINTGKKAGVEYTVNWVNEPF